MSVYCTHGCVRISFVYDFPNPASNQPTALLCMCVWGEKPVVCLFPGGSPVQWPLCRVQQDSAGVFPVGVEERRCGPAGALGVRPVRPSDQPLA